MEHVDTRRARALLDAGALAVEVLPESDHAREHLPGAVSVPLPELTAERVASFDRDRPVLVYCFDTQCDLSGRAAARFAALGFQHVHDYTGSKAAWLAMGWPAEGTVPDALRAGSLAKPAVTCAPDTPVDAVPTAGPGGVVLVVDDDGIVLGSIAGDAALHAPGLTAFDVAYPAPSSVRPSITADELAASMDHAGETHVVVSTLEGVLLGVLERDALRVDR